MMLLVAGVTASTLYVTQRKVQETYIKLYEDQFQSEIYYFNHQQEDILNPFRTRAADLAESDRVRDALGRGDVDAIYSAIADSAPQQVTNRFGRVLNSANQAARGNGGAGLLRSQENTPILVLDSKGGILSQKDSKQISQNRKFLTKKVADELKVLQGKMDKLPDQSIDYMMVERNNSGPLLLAVIITKVVTIQDQSTLGALVVAVQTTELNSERAVKSLSQGSIETGMWMQKRLVSSAISTNVMAEFSSYMTNHVQTDAVNIPTQEVALGGQPRRVFFKLLNPDSVFPATYQVAIFSMEPAMKAERNLRWQIIAFSGLAMIGALVMSLFFAHGFTIPLAELVEATDAVRAGNLQIQVPVRSSDELGQLAESFNEMAEGLAQKEHYRTLLNMVADEKVAQALVNGQLALGGEVLEITVLFCDIRGFTPYTQNMPPAEVIELLNEHMTALTTVVKQNHGVLDKFVGDLLMAIFGAPVSHGNDSVNAVRCALQLMEERRRLNETSRHQLSIGVGISTGDVVAGCMGSMDRLNYTVVGEKVNLASRLCGQAAPGQILMDEATMQKVGHKAASTPLPGLKLKGFKGELTAYELTHVFSWEIKVDEESPT